MISALIVAAGKSTRMGSETDKLFLTVAGRPFVAQTWGRFDGAPFIDEIVIVVREGRQKRVCRAGSRIPIQEAVSHCPRRQGTAGLRLERPAILVAQGRNRRHPGCRTALHQSDGDSSDN